MKKAALAALALLLSAAPALAADRTDPPNERTQPPLDGCQRNPVGLLTFTSAHWSSVYRDNPGQELNRVAEGIAHDTHVAAGDLPEGHEWYDLNFELGLDDPYLFLAGGSPKPGARLHSERESGKTPFFAYPLEGERVKMWGDWTWDCGHWGPQNVNPSSEDFNGSEARDFVIPGSGEIPGDAGSDIRGEGTEFHSFNALGVTRSAPYLPQVGETEMDAFLTTDGTLAHAEARCAREHPPPPGIGATSFYGPDFTACHNLPTSQQTPLNTRDYTFFVPAPPKPTKTAHLRYRVLTSPGNGTAPTEEITEHKSPDGIDVRVPFKGFGSASDAQAYAKSFFVGWDGGEQRIPAHLVIDFGKLTVHNAMDPPLGDFSTGVPPGEYGLTLGINGWWEYLNDWAPGLDHVFDGQELDLSGHSAAINVPDGAPVKLHVSARECDLPRINPCPATPEVAEDNDNPGGTNVTFPSAAAAVGNHVLKGGNNWELAYSVRLASPAGIGPVENAPAAGGLPRSENSVYPNTGPAGSGPQGTTYPSRGCPDTFAPRSRFRGKVHASRRGVSLRGRTGDRRCGKKGKLSRIALAVARRTGGKCRFLQPGGRLGPKVGCKRATYLKAKGGRRWHFARHVQLSRGRYLARIRAVDAYGNLERPARRNLTRFRVH